MTRTLFCTFIHHRNSELISRMLNDSYDVYNQSFFVFQDINNRKDCFLTYNIIGQLNSRIDGTILIHRKKETNTLYTMNALNAVIRRSNNGILDTSFFISWEAYKNSLILFDNQEVKKINLKLLKKIRY